MFFTPESLDLACYVQIVKEVVRTTPRGPNSFYPGQDTLRLWWC